MSHDSIFHRQIVPLPPEAEDVFAVHEVTIEFYREVQYRDERDAYSEWYDRIAEQHRQELAAMQQDINILGWFYRR